MFVKNGKIREIKMNLIDRKISSWKHLLHLMIMFALNALIIISVCLLFEQKITFMKNIFECFDMNWFCFIDYFCFLVEIWKMKWNFLFHFLTFCVIWFMWYKTLLYIYVIYNINIWKKREKILHFSKKWKITWKP